MYASMFITLLTFGLMLEVCHCVVCTPSLCTDFFNCSVVTGCDGPNQVIKPGTCECCNECHTILGEGETCPYISPSVRGSPPPLRQCGPGLVCSTKGKCKKLKASGKTITKN